MRLRVYAPALLAVAAVVALYLFISSRKDDPAKPVPSTPTAQHTPAAPAPALAPPTATPPPGQAPTGTPRALTPEEYAGHEPKAKKPPMILEEKLAETKKHIAVMERRAELIEAEIAELEKKGEKDKAAEQRVVLERLKKHADKLREDVAAGRAPE